MEPSSESAKIKGIRKGVPPRDNSKVGPLGKENLHRRSHSCFERPGGSGGVRPLVERRPNSLSLPGRNFRSKVLKCEDGASTNISDTHSLRSAGGLRSAAPSDSSCGSVSGRGSRKLTSIDSSKKGSPLLQSKNQVRATSTQPFRLLTEQRGQVKEQQFKRKLQQQMDEEEKLRIPIAQRLPLTTDEPQVLPKRPVKEHTKPVNVKLHTESRAAERAEFDHFMDEKFSYLEQRRLEELRIQKVAEEEEIKRLREEMIPYAQVMPYFDRPFIPQKSSKPLTVPKEPKLHCHRRTRSLA